MAQIATVIALKGNVFLVAADGTERLLKVGDVIQQGESVRTAVGATVELMTDGGQVVALAPEQVVRVVKQVAE